MVSSAQNLIGVDFTAVHTNREFEVGQRVNGSGGREYIYLQAGGAITGAGYVVVYGDQNDAVMLTTSNDAFGDFVGVCAAGEAVADNQYFWAQIYGPATIWTEQDALANNPMGATAVAGQVDDAGASGAFIEGMILGTATGASDALNATGLLRYPVIGTVATAA